MPESKFDALQQAKDDAAFGARASGELSEQSYLAAQAWAAIDAAESLRTIVQRLSQIVWAQKQAR